MKKYVIFCLLILSSLTCGQDDVKEKVSYLKKVYNLEDNPRYEKYCQNILQNRNEIKKNFNADKKYKYLAAFSSGVINYLLLYNLFGENHVINDLSWSYLAASILTSTILFSLSNKAENESYQYDKKRNIEQNKQSINLLSKMNHRSFEAYLKRQKNSKDKIVTGFLTLNDEKSSNAQYHHAKNLASMVSNNIEHQLNQLIGKNIITRQKTFHLDNYNEIDFSRHNNTYSSIGILDAIEAINTKTFSGYKLFITSMDEGKYEIMLPVGAYKQSNKSISNYLDRKNCYLCKLNDLPGQDWLKNFNVNISEFSVEEISPEKIQRLENIYKIKSKKSKHLKEREIEILIGKLLWSFDFDFLKLRSFYAPVYIFDELLYSDKAINGAEVIWKKENDKNLFTNEYKIIEKLSKNDIDFYIVERVSDQSRYTVPLSALEWVRVKMTLKEFEYRKFLVNTSLHLPYGTANNNEKNKELIQDLIQKIPEEDIDRLELQTTLEDVLMNPLEYKTILPLDN